MNKDIEAFPRPASRGNNYLTGEQDVVIDPQRGMTLRDYFAAKAMQAMYETSFQWESTGEPRSAEDAAEVEEMAIDAYGVADAMLKARNK